MKTYYTHSKKIFNTEREALELAWLKKQGEVINPNDGTYGKSQVTDFITPVLESDRVVCSEYSKCIGRGAFDQIKAALEAKIPVFVLRPNRIRAGYHLTRVKAVKTFLGNWNHYGRVVTRFGWFQKPREKTVLDQLIHDDYMNFKGANTF